MAGVECRRRFGAAARPVAVGTTGDYLLSDRFVGAVHGAGPRARTPRPTGQGGPRWPVGSGEQWFSWIHAEDWLTIVRAAIGLDPDRTLPNGILVAATEFPVRNRELMTALRRHLHRPPTPAALPTVGAVPLRTAPALGLTGRHATSTVLREAVFRFRYPEPRRGLERPTAV
ncbi:hypothetical protein ACLMAJ_03015 [Nocardia sp. KC 131]|uniref:hypothetical protein n=1 Tax=Nocardia arseniciresistens TaxID=3392119 RepID=UPI00398ED09A